MSRPDSLAANAASGAANQSEAHNYALPGGAPPGHRRALCRTCSTKEMAGIDPARLLADPETKLPPRRAKRVRRTIGHRPPTKRPSTPAVATAPSKTPLLKTGIAVHRSAAPHVAAHPKTTKCAQVVEHMQNLIIAHRDEDAELYLKQALAGSPHDKCIRQSLVKMLLCEASGFMQCGQIECASRRLRETLFVDPRNKQANAMLDTCYAASGIDPSDTEKLKEVAGCMLNQQRPVGAFVEFERLLDAGPDPVTYVGYARAAQMLGQNNIALNGYKAGLHLDPYNNHAWRELGLLQQQLGNPAESESALMQALQLEPNDVIAGDTLLKMKQAQVQAEPGNALKRLNLAKLFSFLGMAPQAETEFANVAALTGNSPQWQQTIAGARTETSFWKREASQARQLVQDRIKQAAVTQFEKLGPSPFSSRTAQSALNLGSGCSSCH